MVFEPSEREWKFFFCADTPGGAGDFRRLFQDQAKRILHLVNKRNNRRWTRY